MKELAESISTYGLLQPLLVCHFPKEKGEDVPDPIKNWHKRKRRYLLVLGARRYQACKALKMKSIPCLIYEDTLSRLAMLSYIAAENSIRSDMLWNEMTELQEDQGKEIEAFFKTIQPKRR